MGDCYQTNPVSDSLMHRTAKAVLFFLIHHKGIIHPFVAPYGRKHRCKTASVYQISKHTQLRCRVNTRNIKQINFLCRIGGKYIMKYMITENTKTIGKTILHQIKSLQSFSDVSAGDLGGWIESEANLSQNDEAWIYEDSCAYEHAYVYDNAKITKCSCVYGHANIYDDAIIENSNVCGNTQIFGDAYIIKSHIDGHVQIFDNTTLDSSHVHDHAIISGWASLHETTVSSTAVLRNESLMIINHACITGDALIEKATDCLIMGPIPDTLSEEDGDASGNIITFFRNKSNNVSINYRKTTFTSTDEFLKFMSDRYKNDTVYIGMICKIIDTGKFCIHISNTQ